MAKRKPDRESQNRVINVDGDIWHLFNKLALCHYEFEDGYCARPDQYDKLTRQQQAHVRRELFKEMVLSYAKGVFSEATIERTLRLYQEDQHYLAKRWEEQSFNAE